MRTTLIALVAGLTLVAACSNSTTDFQKTAAKTIVNEWKKQVGEDLTVTCDKPASTSVGTKFNCTGTGPDGTTYTFSAEITKKDEVTVNQTG
jgi:predicted lysophospholipase L1 biosynthesis ABC-type transport system permease subunit